MLDQSQDLLDRLGLKGMSLNVSDDVIVSNIRMALRRQLPQVWPHQPNGQTVCLVGGGWSLHETFDTLRELHWKGAKLVGLNGASRWLTERNLRPSAQVILDARPFNARFVEPVPDCRYFLASQCAPETFDAAEDAGEVLLWHAWSTGMDAEKELLDRHYLNRWQPIPGTCCVAFRAVMLLRLLGFRRIHVFGVDSCYRDDGRHHAYDQPENVGEARTRIRAAGREFIVSGWQLAQAVQFLNLAKEMGERRIDLDLAFYGDGLITHLVETGASIEEV